MNFFAFAHGGTVRAAITVAALALGATRASADLLQYTVEFSPPVVTQVYFGTLTDQINPGSFLVNTTLGVVSGSFTVTNETTLVSTAFTVQASACGATCLTVAGIDGAGDIFTLGFQKFLDGTLGSGQLNTLNPGTSSFQPFGGATTISSGALNGFTFAPAPGPIPGAGLLSYIALGLLGLGSMGWKRLRQHTA